MKIKEGFTSDIMLTCIIFDFAMTLSSDLYFKSLPKAEREIVNNLIFHEKTKEKWATPWMLGKLNYKDILLFLSEEMNYSPSVLEDILINDIKNMTFNKAVWDFALEIKEKYITAIATVNTDIFTKFVIKEMQLDKHFDMIVNSYEIGNDNKNSLCNIILEKFNLSYNNSLLIDDSEKNIINFAKAGGQTYHYDNDKAFKKWSKFFL